MKLLVPVPFALLVLISGWNLQPCYAGKVRVQVPPGIDMSVYKTYQWLPPRILDKVGVVENDPVIAPLIKEAVNRQLTQRGLREVPEGGDLQVSAGVLQDYIPQVEAVVFGGPTHMMYETPIATMGRYNREGTLIVNLIDTKTKKSAWIGLVTESLDRTPGSGQKKIGPAAEKLFKKFPAAK
jgi:hypothetical protein